MPDRLKKIWNWLYERFFKKEKSVVERPWYWKLLPSYTAKMVIFVAIMFLFLFTIIIGYMGLNNALSITSTEDQKAKILIQQISDSITANYKNIEGNVRWHAVPLAERWKELKEEETLLKDMLTGNFLHSASVTLLPDKKRGITAPLMYRVQRMKDGNLKFETISNRYNIPARMDTMHLTDLTFSKPFITERDTLMPVTSPYLDNQGKPLAYITYTVYVNRYLECLHHLPDAADGSIVMVISQDGQYLMHPDKKKVLAMNYRSDAAASNEFCNIVETERTDSMNRNGVTITFNDEDKDDLSKDDEEQIRAVVNVLFRRADYDGKTYFFTSYREPKTGIFVCVGKPFSLISNRLKDDIKSTAKMTLVLLLIFLFIYRLVMMRMTKPIRRYSIISEHIATGDFDTPVNVVRTFDERQILGESLDYMRVSLKEYMARVTEESAAREAMQKELSIAQSIQMSMLRTKFPEQTDYPHLDLYAFLRSAKEVGGDLYDFYFKGNVLYFMVGDVSGKGVPASLIMAKTITVFRTMQEATDSPAAVVQMINRAVSENNANDMFVTLVVAALDMTTGELRICNAGHDPIVLIREGEQPHTMKVKANLPVGVMEEMPYTDESMKLVSGDYLMLYTDGVAEAENTRKKLYTIDGLLRSLATSPSKSAKDIILHAEEQLQIHTKGAEQNDDITMMCVGYL